MDSLYDFFSRILKKILSMMILILLYPIATIKWLMNSKITADEILQAVQSLKNGNAAGCDNVTNEYLTCVCVILIHFCIFM